MNLSQKVKFVATYGFRKLVRWQRLNGVYLNIGDPAISERAGKAIIAGIYEKDENLTLQKTFTSEDILLELGTGLGFNAIFCAKINGGKVVSFEGNSKLLPIIRGNMKKNGVDFELRNQIVITDGTSETHIAFNIADEFWSSSSKTSIPGKITETVQVTPVPIREIFRQYLPTYLLIDIEGGEEDIFDKPAFLENAPIQKILLELHPDIIGEQKCSDIIQKITDQGFTLKESAHPSPVVYFYRR